ncbi:MAG: sporulation protein YqfD [Oscillospiraceae bacterium]|nr:sporulation protein YqfD [Oscillospiraceae bacterium]
MNAKIKVKIFGAFPESFVNSAAAEGIELWRLERINEHSLCFDTFESCTEHLEQIGEKCSVEMEIKKYREKGRNIIKTRYRLLLVCLGAGLCLLVSSLFIWRIELHGNTSLSRGEILRALEDSGVYVGCFWPGIKADEVRSSFMPKLPDVGWMTVNISGSRAVVLVNERQPKPEIYDESKAAQLVAAKTGIVRRVSVLQGNAAVEPGQAVATGETLAEGRLGSIMGNERLVRARGTVMADTWYEIDSVCPEEMDIKNHGGLVRHRFALVFGKRRINLYFSSGKAIDECDKIINDYNLGVEGHFALPLRLVHEKIQPYEVSSGKAYDTETMGRELFRQLSDSTAGQILQTSLTESHARGLYVLTLRAHCIENIALTQELIS